MSTHLQASLFDQTDRLRLLPLDGIRRTELGFGAWLDVLPGWLTGSDALFEELATEVPWRAELVGGEPIQDGYFVPSDKPGLGIEVDEGLLARFAAT